MADLKEDREEFKQESLGQEKKPSLKFGDRVDKMISKIENELSKYDSEIGSKLHLI